MGRARAPPPSKFSALIVHVGDWAMAYFESSPDNPNVQLKAFRFRPADLSNKHNFYSLFLIK